MGWKDAPLAGQQQPKWASAQVVEPMPQAAPQPMAQPNPNATDNFSAGGVSMGVLDPIYGIGQMVPRAISAVTSIGGLAPNAVSRAYDKSTDQVDQSYKGMSGAYEQGRATPQDFDWGRLTGNVISPVNWLGAGSGPVMKGASLGKKLVSGMGLGAAYGASAPVSDTENYAENKAKQMGLGAATGLVAPLVGAGVDKVLNPKTDPGVRQLLKEGVKLTPGEIAGGSMKRGEDMLASVPYVGGLVKGAQKRSIESLNTAAYNRALAPIGEKLPSSVNMGRDAIGYTQTKLSDKYDELLPKLTAKIDKPFADAMDDLDVAVAGNFALEDADKAAFKGIMDQIVRKRFSGNGTVFGEGIKDIESELGRYAKDFMSDPSASKRNLGAALDEAQDALRDMLQRNNPQYADELSALNKGYANFKRVQRAAAALGSNEGVFTPAQLQSAVKAMDKTKDKSAFAKGSALMQDLSEPAKSRMAQSVPNSGTVDRATALGTLGLIGTGGGAINPMLAIPALAASIPYMPGGRKLAEVMLSKRPDLVRQIGKGAGKYIPQLGVPLAAPLANQIRD